MGRLVSDRVSLFRTLLLLLWRRTKRTPAMLAGVALSLIFMRFVDLFWIIMPASRSVIRAVPSRVVSPEHPLAGPGGADRHRRRLDRAVHPSAQKTPARAAARPEIGRVGGGSAWLRTCNWSTRGNTRSITSTGTCAPGQSSCSSSAFSCSRSWSMWRCISCSATTNGNRRPPIKSSIARQWPARRALCRRSRSKGIPGYYAPTDTQDMRALARANQQWLGSYGPTQENGFVRIPIGRAMDLIVENKMLPTTQPRQEGQ